MNACRRCPVKKKARKGASAVEFALILPLLCAFAMGMMEIGRAAMVCSIMTNASLNGAQVAETSTSSNSTVTSAINSVLAANNITPANATISIQVNGATADCSTANANDKVSVTVSIPASKVNLTSFNMVLLKSATFSGALTVMRQ